MPERMIGGEELNLRLSTSTYLVNRAITLSLGLRAVATEHPHFKTMLSEMKMIVDALQERHDELNGK